MSKPLDNWTSGSGHHLDELVKHIVALKDPQLKITLVHYKKSTNPIYKQIPELIIPRNPFAASRILARQNFDLIHYSPLSVYAPVWGIKAKKTATVHGIEEVLYPQGYSLVHRIHDTKIHPIYMRHMDGIATVSNTSKNYFVKNYRIPEEKIVITHNALTPEYRILTEEQRASYCQNIPQVPYVLHISRYSMRKNPHAIINGFAEYCRTANQAGVPTSSTSSTNSTKPTANLRLVCAGKGWDSSEVFQLVHKAGIQDRYIAPGFISTSDAVCLLNHASAFLFPSFAEGFGMPNIEAMACGCPVITSSIFAIPEVVGEAAILIQDPTSITQTASAIASVLDNPTTAHNLRTLGLQNITRFDWHKSAQTLVNFWKNLLYK